VQDASAYSAPRWCVVHFADCWTCAASWYKVESNVSLGLADITQKFEDFETQEKLSTDSISTML